VALSSSSRLRERAIEAALHGAGLCGFPLLLARTIDEGMAFTHAELG
jgi:hypothetical protein